MKKAPNRRPRNLQYEPLEAREVMAAGLTASLKSGVLNVVGTDSADQINFRQSSGVITITGVTGSWTTSKVKSIVVDLKGGDDTVSLNSAANGGAQAMKEAVTIKSGAGSEHLLLANSHDVYFNGVGNTLVVSDTGAATLNGAALNFTNKATATYKSGVLTITGTDGADTLNFKQTNGQISIGNITGSWEASKITSLIILLQNGNDSVSLDSAANGGSQTLSPAVTIKAGAGTHVVHLTDGNDVTLNGVGHVLTVTKNNGTVKLDGQTLNFNPNPPNPPNPGPNPPATNWFDSHIQDAALRVLGSSLYVDNLINRSDMIALFQSAQDGGSVDATEMADLVAIVSNTTLFGSLDDVLKLSSYIVMGNTANAKYQGQTLGNLTVGSTATQLGNLVNKWFFGLDRPTASGTYRQIAGTLFVSGASYTDVKQGSVGDCYFMTSLAEVALLSPNTITNMFIVNGDGTYAVRFKNGSQSYYVTVDSYLPTNASGNLVYAGMGANYANSSNELWVSLAEKAYVQLNEMGWERAGMSGSGQNSYSAISGGFISDSLAHITGQATTYNWTDAPGSFSTFVNAYNQGKYIGFASYSTPASSSVVGSHAYAVVGYNAQNQTVTLFNPWGIQYGLLTLSWSQIQANFQYFDRTA